MNILTVLCEGIKDSSEVREKEREEREKGYFKYPNYDLVKYIQVFVNIRFLSLPVFVLTLVFYSLSISQVCGETVGDSSNLDVDPSLIENSPVIQKWIKEIPDVSDEIRNQPSFPTLFRIGYSQFPSNHHSGGVYFGIEDLFVGDTPLTFSADYSSDLSNNSQGQRLSVGSTVQYYLLPLGSYINIAPVVGYRYIETNGYHSDGVNVGVKVKLAFSPQGAADISLIQSFIAPTSNDEVGVTEIKAGYAINKHLRLSSGISWQNSIKQEDSQLNIGLEWILK
ncbi:hypothetical protein VKI21_10085 [Cyanobacterium aponinum UTEX 3222]|uniref:Uncharacterized protein n=1 Tax=Cyanobacterium aponinum 0216 TaxID=2676140 RepID=A0A844GRM4_9CHRO|nr:hypothetical protein [Cyanobacterium aponinum 0216]WRL40423.1 hypothetical protein VKI21_10085 [Cyanobacterium aponinum UTEX 3222]